MLRPSPSDPKLRWRVARLKALRGSHSEAGALGAGRRRSPASGSSPPGARAGPARRHPFPGSSPLPSSGPRAPRAPLQSRVRSLARARPPARPLSARSAARRRGSRTRQTRLAALTAAERRPAEAAPSVPGQEGICGPRAEAAAVRIPGREEADMAGLREEGGPGAFAATSKARGRAARGGTRRSAGSNLLASALARREGRAGDGGGRPASVSAGPSAASRRRRRRLEAPATFSPRVTFCSRWATALRLPTPPPPPRLWVFWSRGSGSLSGWAGGSRA